jgi:hypothetical protein
MGCSAWVLRLTGLLEILGLNIGILDTGPGWIAQLGSPNDMNGLTLAEMQGTESS